VTVSSGSEKRQGTITAPDYALPGLEPGPARITISGAQISFEKQIDVPAGAGFHRLDLDVSSAAKPAR
jgi:hypothetical protein